MQFSFPKNTTGILNGDDLRFFYYDISSDYLQGWPKAYDWDAIVEEFRGELDIDSCPPAQIGSEFVINKIRFTVSHRKDSDNGSKSYAFFRHLRNAFAHFQIVRSGDNYIISDGDKKATMRGLVNANLLKKFCYRCFDIRQKIIDDCDNAHNFTHDNQ